MTHVHSMTATQAHTMDYHTLRIRSTQPFLGICCKINDKDTITVHVAKKQTSSASFCIKLLCQYHISSKNSAQNKSFQICMPNIWKP